MARDAKSWKHEHKYVDKSINLATSIFIYNKHYLLCSAGFAGINVAGATQVVVSLVVEVLRSSRGNVVIELLLDSKVLFKDIRLESLKVWALEQQNTNVRRMPEKSCEETPWSIFILVTQCRCTAHQLIHSWDCHSLSSWPWVGWCYIISANGHIEGCEVANLINSAGARVSKPNCCWVFALEKWNVLSQLF